jgi:hypothetical protein
MIAREIADVEQNVTAQQIDNSADAAANQVLQMEIIQLRSEIVEVGMHTANVTQIASGTFIWAFSSGPASIVSESCDYIWGVWQLDNAGTGYVIGELIVLPTSSVVSSPVFQVTSVVNGTGAIVSFDVLTVGCTDTLYLTPQGPFGTLSTNGVGFTVNVSSSTVTLPANNAYYDFPTPPKGNSAAIQRSAYRLLDVIINSEHFNVLELDPPPVPASFISGTSILLKTVMFEFEPRVEILGSLQYSPPYYEPLTQTNVNALSMINCAPTQCFTVADFPNVLRIRNAIGYKQTLQFDPSPEFVKVHNWLQFVWTSEDLTFNYLGGTVQFTLNRPLLLVLPAI